MSLHTRKTHDPVHMDWRDIAQDAFFRLGDWLQQPINRRLGRRNSQHRWGVLSFLHKFKSWKKLETGEVSSWEALTWRPLTSYFKHVWKHWYTLVGQSFSTLTLLLYPLGDHVASTREIPRKMELMRKKFAGTRRALR